MRFESTSIQGVLKVIPKRIEDSRGFFVESFRQDELDSAIGEPVVFVQENCSFSTHQYTVRGLHSQRFPRAQGKLVTCTKGRIRDVVVDTRKHSRTYGTSEIVELNANEMNQLWVPPGLLHGFATLEANTEVYYKCTDYYAPEYAIHVDWQDADLNLEWGFDPSKAVLSDNDKNASSFMRFEAENLKSA